VQTEQVGATLTLYNSIRQVLGSNSGRNTVFSDWGISVVFSIPPVKLWDSMSTTIRPGSLPIILPNHFQLISYQSSFHSSRPSTILTDIFRGLFSSFQKMLGYRLKLGHDRWFQHYFQFVIHNNPMIRRYITLVTDSVIE
jgi:hypothetical protein